MWEAAGAANKMPVASTPTITELRPPVVNRSTSRYERAQRAFGLVFLWKDVPSDRELQEARFSVIQASSADAVHRAA